MTMHHDQLAVSQDTVRRLVDEQSPQRRTLPVRRLDSEGTVNAAASRTGSWARADG
ncbi:hypothetical protein [Cellulomonas hominis]